MTAYYGDSNPDAAAWLRSLVDAGQIAPGYVDDRSIKDVTPNDLAGFTQVHLFAGIGGWPLSARLAGWPDSRPLWTGSCPCQPFSAPGKGRGVDDPRHLWPDFFRLIRTCRPPVVMGEQVAGSLGYAWFDGVRSDLANEGYASRCVDIPALAVGLPHTRNRLFWIADRATLGDAVGPGLEGHGQHRGSDLWATTNRPTSSAVVGLGLADPADAIWIVGHDGKAYRVPEPGFPLLDDGVSARMVKWSGLGNAICPPLAAEVIRAYMDTTQ